MFELDAEKVLHVRSLLSVTVGIIVLFIGKMLNQRLDRSPGVQHSRARDGRAPILDCDWRWCMFSPASRCDFELTARDVLLVYFFTVIGINSKIGDLVRGGKPLGALLAVTVALMFVGNGLGVGAALSLGLDPLVGLLAGSISMAGGHDRRRLGARYSPNARRTKRCGNRCVVRDNGNCPCQPRWRTGGPAS